MCGVIGFETRSAAGSPDDIKRVKALFRESQIRGKHAYGFSSLSPTGVDCIVTHKRIHLWEIDLCLDVAWPYSSLIGHTRYSTSGDWRELNNNQPIHIRSGNLGVSVVFNGVIHQGTKSEIENDFGFSLETANDGEVFARKVLLDEDWETWVREGSFSFAGLFIRNGEITAIRNKNRPLWYAIADRNVYVASTQDIFRRTKLFSEPKQFPVGEAVGLWELP
jgi:glutamine phosphoribosylpyrophosphate amidotransferase